MTTSKQLETIELPDSWQIKTVEEVLNIKRGYSYNGNEITREHHTNIRIININDFDKESGWKKPAEPLYLQGSSLPTNFKLHESDLVIANTDMSKGLIIGAPLFINSIDDKFYFIFSSDLTKLSPVSGELDTKFLYYYLSRKEERSIVLTFAQGTNVLHLNHDLYKRLPIVIPPLSEQQKIAEILTTADETIQKVNEQITLTERLKKGIMQRLLTRGIGHTKFKETEIGEVPETWSVKAIRECSTPTNGIDPASAFGGLSFQYIDVSRISSEKLMITDTKEIRGVDAPSRARKLLKEDDIIFATIRPYLKRVALVPKELDGQVCSTAFCVIRTNKDMMLPRFAYYYTSFDKFVNKVSGLQTGSAYPAVSDSQVLSEKIPVPSLQEQERISNILSKVDDKLTLIYKKKENLLSLKKGLMDDLLTGKVRVKV